VVWERANRLDSLGADSVFAELRATGAFSCSAWLGFGRIELLRRTADVCPVIRTLETHVWSLWAQLVSRYLPADYRTRNHGLEHARRTVGREAEHEGDQRAADRITFLSMNQNMMSGEGTPEEQPRSGSLGLTPGSAITAADAELLREILRRWNNLSNLDAGDPGYHSMTDHCHDTYDAGECLADKLEKIAKASSPNTRRSDTP
jgi:hypothetical protein